MGSTASRIAGVVVAFAVGVIGGLVYSKATLKPEVQVQVKGFAGANAVYVGPTADRLDKPSIDLHISEHPVVYWKPWLPDEGHTVEIRFEHSDFPAKAHGEPPFVNGANDVTQVIQCAGGTCFSYAVNPKVIQLMANGDRLDYKYWQTLDGKSHDGHIIIVKP